MLPKIIPAILLLLPLASVASGAVIVDNFNDLTAGTALNGRTFTAEGDTYTWNARAPFIGSASGSVTFNSSITTMRGTFGIPQVVTGNIYELSADVFVENTASTAWISIGFTSISTTDQTFASDTGAATGAIFLRGNGEAFVRVINTASNTGMQTFTAGTSHNLRVVLDTTVDMGWTLAAYVDGVQLDLGGPDKLYTYSANRTITRAGISVSSNGIGQGSTVDNFSLTVVPEPSPAISLSLAGIAILVLRRRSFRVRC